MHSLVDRDATQRSAHDPVGALMARHPGCSIKVPQLQRLAVGGAALERLGFVRMPLHGVDARGPMTRAQPASRHPRERRRGWRRQ
ncbi:hypothetical protein HK414_19485 [Ramlibacter terrae]|uniref:Uncharacterized protein n=1 Tax=Ramlibacter terrae TaxID=2732511 RepID=A0ABX6P4F4_9BURK|nr:hypothetical protein HK414_19485 [Ramlibacter terrae]